MGEVASCFNPIEELKGAFPVFRVAREGFVDGSVVDMGLVREGIWGLRVEMRSGVWEYRVRSRGKESMNW